MHQTVIQWGGVSSFLKQTTVPLKRLVIITTDFPRIPLTFNFDNPLFFGVFWLSGFIDDIHFS